MKEDGKFDYTYTAPSADERKEISDIRSRYETSRGASSGVEALKRLDAKVRRPALAISLCMGVCGLLIFGLGLSMVLEWKMLVWGSVVALIGLAPMGAAYWTYEKLLASRKRKYSQEIIKLSDELLEDKRDGKNDGALE